MRGVLPSLRLLLATCACLTVLTAPATANKRYPKLNEVLKESLQVLPLGRGMLLVLGDRRNHVCVLDIPPGFVRSLQTGGQEDTSARPTSFCFLVDEFDK